MENNNELNVSVLNEKNNGMSKCKKIFIVIFVALVLGAFVGVGYLLNTSMNDEKSSKENNINKDDNDSDVNDSTIKIDGYTIAIREVESNEDEIYQYLSIYKDDKLIREIPNGESLEKKDINGTIVYDVKYDSMYFSYYSLGESLMVLDKDMNILIDESSIPKLYDRNGAKATFDFYYNTLNSTIAVSEEELYVFDLKGNLLKTLNNDSIVTLMDNYYLEQIGNKFNVMNFDNELVVTLIDDANVKPFALNVLGGIKGSFKMDDANENILFYIVDENKEHGEIEKADYVITYSLKDGKLTKKEYIEE